MISNPHLLLGVVIASVVAFLFSLSAIAEIFAKKQRRQEVENRLWIWVLLLVAGLAGIVFVAVVFLAG